MTGTPRATASLIAPVTLPASEHEIRIALAPSFTAWAMRWAWIWPSSWGGVSQITSIGTPVRSDRSLAAVSAPRRADRNTGLVELFAIIAIRIGFGPAAAAVPAEPSPGAAGFDFGQPAAASAASNVAIAARRTMFTLPPAPAAARRNARSPDRAPPRSRWRNR